MRSWPGLAAVGAALIYLGTAAGSPIPLLVPLVAVGVAEGGWGAASLSRPVPPAPRTALIVLAVTVAAQVLLLLAPGHHGGHELVPVAAIVGAVALDLAVAALLAVRLRRAADDPRSESPLRFLLGTGVGAAVVAVVTATSLASTPIGALHTH